MYLCTVSRNGLIKLSRKINNKANRICAKVVFATLVLRG